MLKLGSEKHRQNFLLSRLNHCPDLDLRYATNLKSKIDVIDELTKLGAPAICHVVSADWSIDGSERLLSEVLRQQENGGGVGTFLSCLPGRLVYFYDENGTRRIVLEKHG